MEGEVERMILQFFQSKDNTELKRIQCGYDVKRTLDEEEEVVYDIKDRMWEIIKQRIRWYYLADAVKDMVDHTYDTEEDEDEEDTE